MSRFSLGVITAAVLVTINVGGLVWIHHDLTAIRPGIVMAKEVVLTPDASRADRLRVVFDRDIASSELQGQAAEEGLFVLEPHWEGSWRWAGADTLEYLFDTPLPAGRRFKLTATDRFGALTGVTLGGRRSFEVLSGSLVLDSTQVVATDEGSVTLELHFSQAVAPGDLLRHMKVCDPGDEAREGFQDVRCLTQGPEQRVVVRTPRPRSGRLRVWIDEHLTGVNADLSLSHTQVVEVEVGQGFVYLSHWVSAPRFSETAVVRMHFSESLSREQVLPEIRTVPAVEDLKIHRSGYELVCAGKFEPEQRYTIYLPGDLESQSKRVLGRDAEVLVEMPVREPGVAFGSPSGILSPAGGLMLDLKAVNVSGVNFHVWRVHENNLVSHLRGEQRYATSRMMPEKTMKLQTVRNEIREFTVNVKDLVQSPAGIYHIVAESDSARWASGRTVVTITDLAITVKSEADGCLVWVTSLRQGTPVEGVEVKAVSFNNQVLTKAVTDSSGIAHLTYPDSRPDGSMWAITAKKGEDIGYVRPGDNQWMIDNVDFAGRTYPQDLEVMLYAERGAYRPGDTVHLTGIVRQRDGGIPPAFPFAIKVIRPDGRTFADVLAGPREGSQGVFHTDVQTRQDGQTGMYWIQAMLPGDHQVLGSTQVFVEAFLPQRVKVAAEASAQWYGPEETPQIHVSGRYLWDQPAAHVQMRAEARLLPVRFASQSRKDYLFGTFAQGRGLEIATVEGRLDDEGKGVLDVQIPSEAEPAHYRMPVTATLTEPGARSVSANLSVVVDLLNHHLGLRCAGDGCARPGEPLTMEWVSLTGTDVEVVPGELQVRLEAVEYESVIREQGGRWVWRSVKRFIEISKETIVATGAAGGSFDIVCPDAGEYRLTIQDSASGSRTEMHLYSYRGGARQNLSMTDPERLEIVTDKEKYRPGDTAKVLIRSPVAGRALVALESDRVLSWQITDVVNNTAEVELELDRELRGSVFVSATVVRAVDPEARNWLPHRAMGMKRLLMDHEGQRLAVKIEAAEKSEPGTVVSVSVETGKAADPNSPAMVHLWAVDEGLLLPTAYMTPDIHRYFFAPRGPGVFTSDLFYNLLPDYERPGTISRIGAGGDYEMDSLRRNPVEMSRRVPEVVWMEAVAAGSDGRVTVEMPLPDRIGQLRLMAVAVEGDRYGATEKAVILTSDLMVESNWPRFAAPGDKFEVPVKVFNSTANALSALLEIAVEGSLEIEPLPQEPIEIEAGKSASRILGVKAVESGEVKIRITARQVGENGKASLTERQALCIRPATTLHGEMSLKSIKAGEKLTVEPSKSFVPGTERLTISVSSSQAVELGWALEKLIRYPYGCLEQTTSRLFALLYAGPILGEGQQDRIDGMVRAGIARLWSMQDASGGLSYWPGGGTTEWGSGYAGWCLLACKRAGYKVDEQFSGPLMTYLESQLQSTAHGRDFQNTRALLCHVLSGFGRPPYGWMGRLAEQKDSLDLAGLAHLAGAYYEAGDAAPLRLLPTEMIDVTVGTTTSGRLTSRVQQYALWLYVLLDIDRDHVLIDPLVNLVKGARNDGAWSSTLENAAAVLALSRYQVLTAGREDPEYAVKVSWAGGEASFDHNKTFREVIDGFREPLAISSEGKGKIYVALSREGLVDAEALQPYDRRISVGRQWTDRRGGTVDPLNIRVGDLVYVTISLSSREEHRIDNIAIVDALAGGMEVENPRLVSSASAAREAGMAADHAELLDDRVVLFAGVENGTMEFKYALRATTAGEFELPALQASCMYDPSAASLGSPSRVRIRR